MEWKAWIDSKLGTNFDAPAYDPQKGRDKLAKVIDKAAEQHSEGKTPPNRTWKVGGAQNAVRFIPVLNGNPIMLDDGKPAFVPAEHFQKFLTQLKASVQAGDLDKEIKAALEGGKPAKAETKPRTARVSTGVGSRAQPDNAEWMAKFVERVGEAPGEGYVPNSKGTKWVSAANAARGQSAAKARFG